VAENLKNSKSGGSGKEMSKKNITNLEALEFFKAGKSVKEIARIMAARGKTVTENALYRHRSRLIKDGLLQPEKKVTLLGGTQTPAANGDNGTNIMNQPTQIITKNDGLLTPFSKGLSNSDVEKIADAMFEKVWATIKLEQENDELKKKVKELENIRAALTNEIAIRDETIKEKDAQLRDKAGRNERVNIIATKIRQEEIANSIAAQE
jgi:hypothetical protein